MSDLELIDFYVKSKSVSAMCNDIGIKYTNLVKNATKKENIEKIAFEVKLEIIRLYNGLVASEIKNTQELRKRVEENEQNASPLQHRQSR